MIKFISLIELLEIHDLLIRKTGGSSGVRDLGRLESAVAAQTQEVFGKEIYPNIYAKAAALIRGIIADHPFVDGNKRTGMLSGLTLLENNGYQTNFIKGEIEDFAVKVAVEKLEVTYIAKWLKAHTKKK